MRYLIAMIFAILCAFGALRFVSSHAATWVVAQRTFDNPDSVADLHSAVFMVVNLVGLLVGWALGWWLGGLLQRPERPI